MYQQSSINKNTNNTKSSSPVNFTPLYKDEYAIHKFSSYDPEKYSYKPQINYTKIITNISISIFLLIGSYFSFLLPQIPNYNFIKELYDDTPKVKIEIQELGEQIEAFYNLSTQEEKQQLLLYNIPDNYNTLTNSYYSANIIFANSNKPIIRFTQQNTNIQDLSTLFRLLKEKTNSIIDKSQLAKTQLENYQSIIDKKSQTNNKELQKLINQINDNNTKAKKFVSESEKMSNYYYKVFDAMIVLINQLYLLKQTIESSPNIQTTQILTQIQEFEYISNQKYTELKRITSNELPENSENLHSAILEFTQNFINLSKHYKSFFEQKTSAQQFIAELNNLSVLLDASIAKINIYESDFWQNNRYLRSYKQYANNYQDIQNELEKQITKKKLPLLSDIAVFFE